MKKSTTPATPKTITSSLKNLILNSDTNPNPKNTLPFRPSSAPLVKKKNAPSLVSLCVGMMGKHLEDLIPDLREIAVHFPANVKMAIAAIARRRKLLNNEVILSLVDETWEILDVSCSDVSDIGLAKVAEICRSLRAVDISRCSNITPHGVFQLLQHCQSLEILRCGGCPRSDFAARRSLGLFKPELNSVEGESWEELDTTKITHGGQSLMWLVWPKIDPDSLENLSSECPRIKVNPEPSPFSFKRNVVPKEALPNIALDERFVEDVDPSTWASCGPPIRLIVQPASTKAELSMAEKFRLAFVERDTRLAPKRAKNARQHQRRVEREWMTMSAEGKAIALASEASKSLRARN